MIIASKILNGRSSLSASEGHLNPQCDLTVFTGFKGGSENICYI